MGIPKDKEYCLFKKNLRFFEATLLPHVLTDLSKAFDCILHEMLIAKLNAYGSDIKSLNFILAYLNNRKQKTEISSSSNNFLNILFDVPQGSILGPLLFVIFICDLFMEYDAIEFALAMKTIPPLILMDKASMK